MGTMVNQLFLWPFSSSQSVNVYQRVDQRDMNGKSMGYLHTGVAGLPWRYPNRWMVDLHMKTGGTPMLGNLHMVMLVAETTPTVWMFLVAEAHFRDTGY